MPQIKYSVTRQDALLNVWHGSLQRGFPVVNFTVRRLTPGGVLPNQPPKGVSALPVWAALATCCRKTVLKYQTWDGIGVQPLPDDVPMQKSCGSVISGRIGRVWVEVIPNMTNLPGIIFAPHGFALDVLCADKGGVINDLIGLDWLHHAVLAVASYGTDIIFPQVRNITVDR